MFTRQANDKCDIMTGGKGDQEIPQIWQPQIFKPHLAVCPNHGLPQRRGPERQVAILGSVPSVQLILNVLSNSGICANVVLLHEGNEIPL